MRHAASATIPPIPTLPRGLKQFAQCEKPEDERKPRIMLWVTSSNRTQESADAEHTATDESFLGQDGIPLLPLNRNWIAWTQEKLARDLICNNGEPCETTPDNQPLGSSARFDRSLLDGYSAHSLWPSYIPQQLRNPRKIPVLTST